MLVVIGASAGGIETLRRVLPALPEDFAAAVAVVLHRQPFEEGDRLPAVLARGVRLPVRAAVDRQRIEPGQIVVCPADVHLRVEGDTFVLDSGPRENNSRPAIDVLFRTAAASFGPAVAGVVLSGMLDDGSDGLAAIHARGGKTIVQDPTEALFADMPRYAMEAIAVDVIAKAAEIPGVLMDFVNGEKRSSTGGGDFEEYSEPSEFACPDCHGVLWNVRNATGERLRCRTGHAFTPIALHQRQSETLEDALWAAVRALEEHRDASAALSRRLRDRGLLPQARRLERAAIGAERRAALVRTALPSVDDARASVVDTSFALHRSPSNGA